jgi:hypothetical protein
VTQQHKQLDWIVDAAIFWGLDNWCGTHLRENFRNPSSRDTIFLTVECNILKFIAIMRALANGNFSRKCSSGGPKIESGLPGRASLREYISPILKRASSREIWASEYIFEPSVSVRSFCIFRASSLSARNNRQFLIAEISQWMGFQML